MADGGGDSDFNLWLREWDDAGGCARVLRMSKDGLFFKSVGKLHPKYKTPVAGLLVQAVWTVCCACLDLMGNCWTTSFLRSSCSIS